ncbi:MAG: DnaJ domain-containing protein [Eubacteriales bacterium]|nr:DnaJ domain-containing protein [Eubacteriales bacterium]
MKTKNYYEILEVNYNATELEIKRSFRRLAKIYHPDVNKNSEENAFMVQILKAYEILSDPILRKKYDTMLGIENNYEYHDINNDDYEEIELWIKKFMEKEGLNKNIPDVFKLIFNENIKKWF